MLQQVLIGSGLMLLTTVVHAIGMSIGFRWLTSVHNRRELELSMISRSLVVGVLVLIMFVATLIESGFWAALYLSLDTISEFENALYFSLVTYTTLGYGDVVLEGQWRLLSSFQAANGIIMFGWTTAVIIVGIKDVSRALPKLRASD